VELGLDRAVHGEPATAIEAMVNELAITFQSSFIGMYIQASSHTAYTHIVLGHISVLF